MLTGGNSYLDLYVSDQAGASAFLGNRSVVIHSSNTTRLTCANSTLLGTAASSSSGMPPVATPMTKIPDSGGADAKAIGGGVLLASLFAALL